MSSNISFPQNFSPLSALLPTTKTNAVSKKSFSALANSDFPEAYWNLGGVFLFDNVQKQLQDFAIQMNLLVENHGAPPCAWTLEWFQSRPLISPKEIQTRLSPFANDTSKFILYFDNPHIRQELLNDAIGNWLLQTIAQMPNAGISVDSEILAEHIRKTAPTIHLRAGSNKVIAENGQGNADYYKNMIERFSVISLHPDDSFNFPLLENLAKTIDPKKIEITINNTCLRNCPQREAHLAILAKIRESPWDATLLQNRHKLLADAKCENVCVSEKAPLSTLLSREELKMLYALGFRRFRLQAETLRSEITFFWSALRWFFSENPEHWHYFGLVTSSLSTKIKPPIPILPEGLSPFVKRKYD